MPFDLEKLEWCGYPTVKINSQDILFHFERMHECDGHTNRHMPCDGIGRACKASRGKNCREVLSTV